MNLDYLVQYTEILSIFVISTTILALLFAFVPSLLPPYNDTQEDTNNENEAAKITVTHQATSGEAVTLEFHYSHQEKRISDDEIKALFSKLIKQLEENNLSDATTDMVTP